MPDKLLSMLKIRYVAMVIATSLKRGLMGQKQHEQSDQKGHKLLIQQTYLEERTKENDELI